MSTQLLKVNNVAEKLNISISMAYQLIQRGEINAVHIGRAVRVREEDLEKYVNQQIRPASEMES